MFFGPLRRFRLSFFFFFFLLPAVLEGSTTGMISSSGSASCAPDSEATGIACVPDKTACLFTGFPSVGVGANGRIRSPGFPSSVTGDVRGIRVESSGRAGAASISLRLLFLPAPLSAGVCCRSEGRSRPRAKG